MCYYYMQDMDALNKMLDKINELKMVSGKTVEELIHDFKDGRVTIREPLFKIGDSFVLRSNIEDDNGARKITLYCPRGKITKVLSNSIYELEFLYGIKRTFHEDYLNFIKEN